MFEHVAAQTIFLGGSCEFASRPIHVLDRGLLRQGFKAEQPSGVAFFWLLFLAKQEK